MVTPTERARSIVAQGGQILLPFKAGDAEVCFPSRWELAVMIETAITSALAEEKLRGLPS